MVGRADMMSMQQMCMSGNWRGVADWYRNKFESTPTSDQWSFYYVSGFSSIFRERQTEVMEDDLSFMKKIMRDKSVPLVHRVEFAFALGVIHFNLRARQKAADYYRKCIDLGKSATASDNRKRYIGIIPMSQSPAPVGDRIQKTMKDARDNLAILERNTPSLEVPDHIRNAPPRFPNGAPIGIQENRYSIAEDKCFMTSPEEKERILKSFKVGGGKCDNCNADKPDGESLLRCSKCKRAWYCSKQCQQSHWKLKHKQHCKQRDALEFIKGDICQLNALVAKPELNGLIVAIVKPAEKEGRYEVSVKVGEGPSQPFSVAKKNLALMVAPDC